MIFQSTAAKPRPQKAAGLLADLRGRILAGEWQVGERLPPRLELDASYGASSRTMQKVLTRLIRDGFLVAERHLGTSVAEFPPHLCHFGLVFPFSPATSQWSGHWQALRQAAAAMDNGRDVHFSYYFGMESPADLPGYQKLVCDVTGHRVAGLVFASPPFCLAHTPVLELPGIPRLQIASESSWPQVAVLAYESASYNALALDHLAAAGRRRVALVFYAGMGGAYYQEEAQALQRLAARRGLDLSTRWMHGLALGNPFFARTCIEALTTRPAADRPDALMILDDNLVADVTAAIRDLGLRIPDDLEIVAHANFPTPPAAAVPVWSVGYDMRDVLAAAIHHIQAVRRGESPAATIRIPARHE